MSDLTDWFDPNSAGGILTVIFGFILLLTLATQAPVVLGVLGFLLFMAWAGIRSGELVPDKSTDEPTEHDPLKLLQKRYARGEISEEEFEQRLTTILNADELAGRNTAKPDRDRDRDLLTERT
jgi:uncharacterized membrane protein